MAFHAYGQLVGVLIGTNIYARVKRYPVKINVDPL